MNTQKFCFRREGRPSDRPLAIGESTKATTSSNPENKGRRPSPAAAASRGGWTHKPGQRGGVMIVTLLMTALIGFFLFGYISLTRTQSTLVARSQAWNAAIGMAEAGVEEALAQLNPGAPAPVIDMSANGWGPPAGAVFGPVTRTFKQGSYSVIFVSNTFPTIYATGYVAAPFAGGQLLRVLKVDTTNAPLFTVAMAAKGNINLAGNGIATDSFNSADPNFSTNGLYTPLMASTNGDIASVAGVVNVGNGNVKGSVFLGPTATDSISKNGVVTGGVSNDFNVEFEDVVLPQVTWLPIVSSTTTIPGDTNTYQYAFFNDNYDYKITSLSGNIYVATNVHVRLLLTGDCTAGKIRVAGAGTLAGHLTVYMDGPKFTLSGSDIVDSRNALSMTYYGTTNNLEIAFKGNADFVGTIYAPQADFKMGGGGSGIYDFIGSSVTKTVTMNGHYKFHYDENLAAAGPKLGFVPCSWREL